MVAKNLISKIVYLGSFEKVEMKNWSLLYSILLFTQNFFISRFLKMQEDLLRDAIKLELKLYINTNEILYNAEFLTQTYNK